jgi:hypothetical protein
MTYLVLLHFDLLKLVVEGKKGTAVEYTLCVLLLLLR